MKTAILLVSGFALLGFASMGGANHGCNGNVIDIGGQVYIDDRDYLFGNGLWIYVESNGIAGLQSGGAAPGPIGTGLPVLGADVDPCFHANHDTLIF